MSTMRNPGSMRFGPSARVLAAAVLAVVLAGGCGGGGDQPTGPVEPTTPETYTTRGWQRFTTDDFAGALADFNEAVALEAGYGPALAGRGWALLSRAGSDAAMQDALTAFMAATAAGNPRAHVIVGKAVAYWGSGDWAAADMAAQVVLALAPDYVFEHRRSFTRDDLLLIIAAANAAEGDMSGALAAADMIAAAGIDEARPDTWTVGGVAYGTFAGAVLARLQELSDIHAG